MSIRRGWLAYGLAGVVVLIAVAIVAPRFFAAQPARGTISAGSPSAYWSGGPFLVPNPVSCDVAETTCDQFSLTIDAPAEDFVVTVRITARSLADDLDLFVRDASGVIVARSATPTGVEEVSMVNPAAGTYTVVVQPYLVQPAAGGAYDGIAGIGPPAGDEFSRSYHGAIFTADFAGVPQSRPARSAPGGKLRVSFNPVGRQAAEPTVGVNKNNTAFFVAGAFDSTVGVPGQRLARSVIYRSRDKGASWQAVSPPLLLQETGSTEPAFSLDPMIHVDPVTGRVFSLDLYVGCSWMVYSDDEGVTWQRNPLACGQPVNDHHTFLTPPPAAGLTTTGYPNMFYYCFNRVADSSCGRSHDGGRTFAPAGIAFTGADTVSGNVCGGLHGHLAGDRAGRVFVPKGHCGLPWIAISEDGANSFSRVNIAPHTPMDDHEVSLAVDTADNVYAVWQDRAYRLVFLSASTDHGRTWSTPIMMAPPGVREVNFPTIVAGDPGRIAVLFPGSESANFEDETRPWNLYVVMSTNALAADPVFTWTTANDPGDPVHRGSCGPGRCDAADGGSMFDFLDIQVSPGDGAFWGTASDTCVGECLTNPQAQKLRPGQGMAIRQVRGPSLFRRR
jgi:hypothetical protein